jgi:hypothetical protein
MQKLLLICAFFLLGFYVTAQQSTYLIKAGKLFDSESGQFKTGQVILVKGNLIDAVKPKKT